MLCISMRPEVLLPVIALGLLATVFVFIQFMELRVRVRISKELDALGGSLLEVRRAKDEREYMEAPQGSLYEVRYVNRWGREGRRWCRVGWIGGVIWLRRQ